MTARICAPTAFILLCCLLLPSRADAAAREPYRVPRVAGPVRVDGVIDEPLWNRALRLELRYEVRPGDNAPPPVRTEVLIAYSGSHLLAAFRAHDPDPSRIRARLSDRDRISNDDRVSLVIDSFDDRRRMFVFSCNPLGVQGDAVETIECSDDSWDAIWDSAGRITARGYEVEMAIPFSSLRFQRTAGDQAWNFDAVRIRPRSVSREIGLFPRDRSDNCYLCQAERLVGFAGAVPGRNVEIAPTFSSLLSQARENGLTGDFVEKDRLNEPGLDARWGVTPNLQANATINPDFSQVEADARQLDINEAFALFYEEKRPFFLEGADLFATPFNLVHTRTIADPAWGAKLTGKEGRHAIGFYTARDNTTNLLLPGPEGSRTAVLEGKSHGTALRYRRDVLSSSTIGLLFTDREAGGYCNRAAGIDGLFRLTSTDIFQFQLVGSRTRYPEHLREAFDLPGGTLDGRGIDLYYLHGTESLDLYAACSERSGDLRLDLGFLPRTDVRRLDAGWGYTLNGDDDRWFTLLNAGAAWETDETTGGRVLMQSWTCWFDYMGPLQSGIHGRGTIRGKEGFGGAYFDNRRWTASAYIEPTRWLKLVFSARAGDRIDYANRRAGRQLLFSPGIELAPGRHLSADISWQRGRLDVAAGRLYTARIARLRLVWQFTRRAFVRTILQRVDYERNAVIYGNPVEPREENLFTQALFSYKINPRTVLYLGYSDDWYGDRSFDLARTGRTFFMKIGYAWVP